MAVDPQLTVLLPLKGRAAFTQRWLAYAETVRFPWKIYLADGSPDDETAHAISNGGAAAQHVDVEYVRYPPDTSYTECWAKIADALAHIRTPYVAFADNDDLLVVNGVDQAVRFLMANPDYVSCGGQTAVFWVHPSTQPSDAELSYRRRIEWKSSLDRESLTHDTAAARIRHLSRRATHSAFYHVRRTADFRMLAETVRDADLHDPFLIERFLLFLTAIHGKTKQLETMFIARQWNPQDSDGAAHLKEHGDWYGRMLAATWSRDFSTFLQVTSERLARQDGLTIEDARRCVIDAYRGWVSTHLLGDLLSEPTVSLPMALTVRGVHRLLDLQPNNPIRRIARWIYRSTRWISVDVLHGTQFRTREVPGATEAFGRIREFLRSGS